MPYLIDTDAIVHIADRPDGDAVYQTLIHLVGAGELRTVEQVFDELRRWPDIQSLFQPLKKEMIVEQYIPEVMNHVGYISENFDFLFDLTGAKNPDPADPWLIGCAKHYDYTLVTDERKQSTKRIPFVCRQQGVDVLCISGTELVWSVHGKS
ncbi:DUF4411 family protein [Sphingomonas sp. M1-B02]|uniref:DUF4411 family protein n=1 Tax=Sphingomonas sp. M1-B02 TaxID=3114300 RepID=UPI00224017CF|nr:DUF4411 family protein [Sphingomonas sp. S6-11]UZK67158.1 DUF4411 family protein [Sphingomonas sp. S6-11]